MHNFCVKNLNVREEGSRTGEASFSLHAATMPVAIFEPKLQVSVGRKEWKVAGGRWWEDACREEERRGGMEGGLAVA